MFRNTICVILSPVSVSLSLFSPPENLRTIQDFFLLKEVSNLKELGLARCY